MLSSLIIVLAFLSIGVNCQDATTKPDTTASRETTTQSMYACLETCSASDDTRLCDSTGTVYSSYCEAECYGLGDNEVQICTTTSKPDTTAREESTTCTCDDTTGTTEAVLCCDNTDDLYNTEFSSECEARCGGCEMIEATSCTTTTEPKSTESRCPCDDSVTSDLTVCCYSSDTDFETTSYADCCGTSDCLEMDEGACPSTTEGCYCIESWEPVCCMDDALGGETFSNECSANCAGCTEMETGECSDCTCDTDNYAPVCCNNGETFDTECWAECGGCEAWEDGECEDCYCIELDDPVCCMDYINEGETFDNECKAECGGCDEWEDGACGCDRDCDDEYEPVCCTDDNNGNTYANECTAKCNDCERMEDGICDGGCICTSDYAPVCCEDNGETYSNRCGAECVACPEDSITEGECLFDATTETELTPMPADATRSNAFLALIIASVFAWI